MAGVHAAGWQQTDAELVGVMSKNKQSAAELAKKHGIRHIERFEELLEYTDIIDICVPTDLHKGYVLEAAKAGKHILCEKPLALTLEDSQAMIEACEAAGVRLFNALVVRFFPQYRAAREAVMAGQIGKLGVMRFKRVGYPPKGDEDWFTQEERSGGMIVDLMIHDFDYARWLAGEADRVYAKSVRESQSEAAIDYALVTIHFKSGAMAQFEGGWAYPPGYFRTSLDIAGSEGLLEWQSDDSQTIKAFLKTSEDKTVARVAIPSSVLAEDPYTSEIKHAYDAIKNNKAFLVTPQDGLEALRLALAAKESLKTGKAIRLGGR
jgi:predicted dehydrogenase